MEIRLHNFKCPYCGNERKNIGVFNLQTGSLDDVVVCNSDGGGCGVAFYVKINVIYEREIYKIVPVVEPGKEQS